MNTSKRALITVFWLLIGYIAFSVVEEYHLRQNECSSSVIRYVENNTTVCEAFK